MISRGKLTIGLLVLSACSKAPPAPPSSSARPLEAAPSPRFPSSIELLERRGTGRLRYLGFDLEPAPPLSPGATVKLTHYFEVLAPLRGDYAVLVDLSAPGSAAPLASDAHRPGAPSHTWKPGERWADTHKLRVPKDARGSSLELFVALAENGERMTVQAEPGGSDGRDRARVATLALDSSAAPIDDGLPIALIPRATSTITPDGVLDEPAWAKAPVLGFADTMGRDQELRFKTRLKLLWDDEHLYVGFDSDDEDITCPYVKRDDPIYDHETVELFIMPHVIAPGLGPYIELQASPKGIIFDASFTARRQGMDKSFDGAQTVGTKLRGTLNDPSPDTGWTSEWKVPWKSLRWVKAAPKAGEEWRMNAFRIEKNGAGLHEYGAWSPPRVGDFHAVDRFGRMRFAP